MTNSKTSKKLQCIDLDLTAYPYVDIKSNSSLLLGYIYDSEKSNRDLDQMEFSPMEFAIYLYYEFCWKINERVWKLIEIRFC